MIDNSYDLMWENLLSFNPHVTPESLTRILEIRVDTDMFDEAHPSSVVDFEGSQEDLQRKHDDLAGTWLKGPHDLVNSPFDLPSVIPDPYSHERDALDVVFEVTEASSELKALHVDEENPPLHKIKAMPGPRNSRVGNKSEKYALGCRFFVTDGNFMGLGPPQAMVGDIVAVFFGSDVPFVLRLQEDKFRLIGEAHVQVIMDGEVMEWWKNEDPREHELFEHPTSLKENIFIIV